MATGIELLQSIHGGIRRLLGSSGALDAEGLKRQVAALRAEADGLRHLLAQVRIPPLIVTTMPRSGTYFISRVLSQGFQVPERIIANQYFPYDRIRFFELKKLADEGGVSQDHFDSHPFNVTMIRHFSDRIAVQIRDPRQAMLSWVHHVGAFDFSEETYKFVYPVLPRAFPQWALEQQIDWAIENWLPLLVEWTRGWADPANTEGLKVKIMRFEDMVDDERKFFGDLIDFFGIPSQRFLRPSISHDADTHFRKGEKNEWRSVFSSKQVDAASRHIPRDLVDRFGWLP